MYEFLAPIRTKCKSLGCKFQLKYWMVGCWLCIALPTTSFADPILTFDLSNPVFDYASGKALEIDIRVRLTSDNPVDEVDFVQISLTASDAFSLYAFTLDPGRTNWLAETEMLNPNGVFLVTTPGNPQQPATAIKADGEFITLGRLRVDFASIDTDTASLSIAGTGAPNETTGLGSFGGDYMDIVDANLGELKFSIGGAPGSAFMFSTTAVPEPSSLAMPAILGVGMMFRRKRKQLA